LVATRPILPQLAAEWQGAIVDVYELRHHAITHAHEHL